MATVARENSDGREPAILLRGNLNRVANRIRIIGAVDSLLWAVALVGIALLLLAWMDIIWHFSTGPRHAIIPLALLSGICSFAVLVHRAWKHATADRVARRLDEVGHTGGQILSGWELLPGDGLQNRATIPLTPLARGIAAVAVEQASQRAATLHAADAVPWRESRRSGITAAVVTLATLSFALLAPGAFSTSWNRIASPSVDTPPYSPLLFEVTPGDVEINYGQPLQVTAEISGGAIENASLVLGDPDDPTSQRMAMFARGGGRWQAVLPRVTETTLYCVSAGRGRSRLFELRVLETPKIESATFTITAPRYANLLPLEGRYPQDRIAGLVGTKVDLAIVANRPLHSGTVTIESAEVEDETVPLSVSSQDPRRVVGAVYLQRAGNWSISVAGVNGVACESPIRMEVELLIDQPPIVRITQPRPKSYATPDTQIPVAAVADDDYGIARLRLYRMIDGSRPTPLELPIEPPARTVQGGSLLPLAAFGLEPGDRITLLARADDTRPDASQGGESALAEIDIISQLDFDRIIAARQGKQMLENKFRQAKRLLEQLATEAAELQQQLDASDQDDANQQQQLQERIDQLRQKMADVADALDELAKQQLPLEVDKHWNELLQDQARSLREAATDSQALQNKGADSQEQADAIQTAIDAIRRKQDEQIGQPMEALSKIAPLVASESKYVQLVARQHAVVDALDRFRQDESIRDEADRQQIVALREQEADIRRDMADLMNEIESHADVLGDDPDFQQLKQSSLEFVAAVRASDIDRELSEARQSLGRFNAAAGYGHAVVALEAMEKLLSQCNSNAQQACNCLKNKFAPGLPAQRVRIPCNRCSTRWGSIRVPTRGTRCAETRDKMSGSTAIGRSPNHGAVAQEMTGG